MAKIQSSTKKLNKLLSYSGAALLLLASFLFLHSAAIFKDLETRWQRFFYDFRVVMVEEKQKHDYPLYLVELNDSNLPENTCRSPVDKAWLNSVLDELSDQSINTIGIHLILEDSGSEIDNSLKSTIKKLDNVVLLDSPNSSANETFRNAAKSSGSATYKFNSNGDVQYVCSDPASCTCLQSDCTDQRVFFRELIEHIEPGKSQYSFPGSQGWLKLFFQYSPEEIRRPLGKKPFTKVTLAQLKQIKSNSFPQNSVVLIGTGFRDLYKTYRIPRQSLSDESSIGLVQEITSLELSAVVLDMILNKVFLTSLPTLITLLLLGIFLSPIALFSWRNRSYAPVWLALLFIFIWNNLGAMSMVYFLKETPVLLPSLLIFTYSLYCIRYQMHESRFEKLFLENKLEQERFNGLVDRFHSHSVFNALEHIRYLIKKDDDTVDRYILDYSTLLLDDLRHHPQQLYPLSEQLDYIQNYLQLQNLKIDNKVDLQFKPLETDHSSAESIKLHWKLFFPLVENAFKHAKSVSQSNESGHALIKIETWITQKSLEFCITNSYRETQKPAGTGQGLINLKQRLNLLYPKNDWQLNQTTEDGEWRAILVLPLNLAEH